MFLNVFRTCWVTPRMNFWVPQGFKYQAPKNPSRLTEQLLAAIDTEGQATDVVHVMLSKDGREVALATSALPVLDASGKRIGFRGVDKDISERVYNEKVQDALRSISDAALIAPDMAALLQKIQEAVGTVMPADNFYVALYDSISDLISYPYFVDEFDSSAEPRKPGKDITSVVLRSGKPLLVTQDVYEQMEAAGEVERRGTLGADWLGVPLQSGERSLGVLAVQTYTPDLRLTERDRDTLAFLANQVAVAIERKQSELELRTLFSSITDVIIVYDREGRYLRIAPTNPTLMFKPPVEMLGQKIVDVLPPETHASFLDAIQTTLDTNQVTRLEYPLVISGQTFWFDASISKLSEDQVYWVARDVTERRNFEETLRRQNEYLASSAEIGRLVTSTLDLDTLFSQTVELIHDRFGFYHVSIFNTEESGVNAILRSATGTAGEEMLRIKHSLPVGSRSIVGTVTSSGSPMVVNNTTIDPDPSSQSPTA